MANKYKIGDILEDLQIKSRYIILSYDKYGYYEIVKCDLIAFGNQFGIAPTPLVLAAVVEDSKKYKQLDSYYVGSDYSPKRMSDKDGKPLMPIRIKSIANHRGNIYYTVMELGPNAPHVHNTVSFAHLDQYYNLNAMIHKSVDNFTVKQEIVSSACKHNNKYINDAGGIKFWFCRDCKADLGDA